MLYHKRVPAVLIFEDGTRFDGFAVGKIGTSGGEICFNTGMTGYQEIYTDPSYYGQIVVNTNSHIGNYGATDYETESKRVMIQGLVVRNFSQIYSRHTAQKSLQEYLEQSGIVGISDVDTRSIVRHIRKAGVMNAIISSEHLDSDVLMAKMKEVPNMKGLELSSLVTTSKVFEVGDSNAKYRVAVLDLGIKRSILKNFTERGCLCKVFPAKTSYEEMEDWNADGFFISNGPGDPAAMPYAVETVTKILANNKPVFGICLGHQILAQASGVGTYKMHNGHRGLNHPVKHLESGHCEITSQNHGFAVKREDLLAKSHLKETHLHLNDGTVAGFRRLDKPAFSVQYHPESSPGPHDSTYLFDEFIDLMNK